MANLSFFDVTANAVVTTVAIGTVAPASSDDTLLRLRNTNPLYQAENVTVTITGDDAVQLWLSTDGDTFSPAIDVGDIPPGATSAIFWLRRVTPSTTSAGAGTATLSATPSAWGKPDDSSTSTNVALTEG